MKRKSNVNNPTGKMPGETDYEYMVRSLDETNNTIKKSLKTISETNQILRASIKDQVNNKTKEAGGNCGRCTKRASCLLFNLFTQKMRDQLCPEATMIPENHSSTLHPRIEIPEANDQWENRLYDFMSAHKN